MPCALSNTTPSVLAQAQRPCVPEEAKCVTHGSKYSGNTLQLHEELAHLEQDVSNKTIVGEIIDGGFSHPLVATYS